MAIFVERNGLWLGLSIALFFLARFTASAQVILPETPAGVTLKSWLEVLNSGNTALADHYVKTIDPTESTSDLIALHDETGGFELLSIESSEPLHLRFFLREKDTTKTTFGNLLVRNGKPPTVEAFGLKVVPSKMKPITIILDETFRGRVITGVESDLTRSYIDLPIAESMNAALTAHQRSGDYKAITDPDAFAARLTQDLRAISHDRHLGVEFSPFPQPIADTKPSPSQIARDNAETLQDNCAFRSVTVLPNNIGYLKFDAFMSPDICASIASAAMAFLAHTSALIIDLRENSGGDPAMVSYIATYFFDKPIHLNDMYIRKNDSTRQYWTLPAVPGERLASQPVYVLTSKNTFSGAEEFSYDLQAQKRATIVGEVTGGGAHPIHGYTVAEYFTLEVPEGRPINPVTHTDWEGKGIVPEIKTEANDALAAAEKLATEKIQAKSQ